MRSHPHVITQVCFIKLTSNLLQHSLLTSAPFYFFSTAFQGERQKVGREAEREGEVREKERKKTLSFSSLISALCDKIQSQAVAVHNPPPQQNTQRTDYKSNHQIENSVLH